MKRFKKLKLIALMAVLLTIFAFVLPTAIAEESGATFTISPAINEIKVDPGEKKQGILRVYNNTEKPLPLRVDPSDFEAADLFGTMNFIEISEPTISLSSWFSFDRPSMLIAGKSIQELRYTIDVPKNAEPGGHYGVVFFETIPPEDNTYSNDAQVSARVGAIFLVTVSGQILEKGRVMGATSSDQCSGVDCSFKTEHFREWGPVPYEFKFENTGNVHVKVTGKIEIYNLFGKKTAELPVDEQTVLPDSARIFKSTWLREPLFGFYKAKLTISYGSLNVTDQAETSFIAFPLKIFLGVIIIVLIFIFFKKIYPKFKYKLSKKAIQK